jgi:hypothetical protein
MHFKVLYFLTKHYFKPNNQFIHTACLHGGDPSFLCSDHQNMSLMMEAKTEFKMLETISILTWLTAREDFIFDRRTCIISPMHATWPPSSYSLI